MDNSADNLALFCVGGFVGAIATYGLYLIRDTANWLKAITAVLSAALGGVSLAFVRDFQHGATIASYASGLLLALIWSYFGVGGPDKLAHPSFNVRVAGWLQLFGTVLVSVVGFLLFVFPYGFEVWKGLFH